jgi:hypothetical protein
MKKNSQEKNLVTFAEMAEKDPLFAAEGLDLENCRQALDELVNSLKDIKKSWKSLSVKLFFLKYPILETAHPISFLKSFIDSETARREFIKKPDLENAEKLVVMWSKTLNEYKQGINSYRSALLGIQRLEAIKDDSRIAYFDTNISFKEFIKWTELLDRNASRLADEIESRKLILKGNDPALLSTDPRRGYVEKTNSDDENHSKKIPEKLSELVEIAQSKFKKEDQWKAIPIKIGHFDQGVPTLRNFNVSIARTNDLNLKFLAVILADDMYFLNLRKGHFLNPIIYRPLLENNLDYWYQPATTFYASMDISYQAELATIVDHKRRKFNNPHLVDVQKSSLFDLLIGTGIYYNTRFSKLLRIFSYHKCLPKLSFFYLARAYPSLYFLSFNKSVWRLDEDFRIQGTRFGSNSGYENYEKVSSEASFEALKKVVEISIRRSRFFKKEISYYD